jgi:membrane protein DedA with SNARE-associated domain
VVVYFLVGLVIGLESMGIPLPGEVILVSSALLASSQELDVSPGLGRLGRKCWGHRR